MKYAQGSDISVRVAQEHTGIRLMVGDSGQGFDVEQVKREKRGLGLISMEERARLIGGQVTIASQPGQGTVIQAFVPSGYLFDDSPKWRRFQKQRPLELVLEPTGPSRK